MKKAVALLLVLVMVFALCACGGSKNKAAFEASKEAYNNIIEAYNIVEAMGADIYEAWRLGIYEKDDVIKGGAGYLEKELHLTKAELTEGILYYCSVDLLGLDWNAQDSDEIKTLRNELPTDGVFKVNEDNLFSTCVQITSDAYKANGKFDEANDLLNVAKGQMKELSENYSDYEHYPNLKGLYTTTRSFFDFCENPTGSFEQVKTTINDYKNTARDYISDLDYIFEDD